VIPIAGIRNKTAQQFHNRPLSASLNEAFNEAVESMIVRRNEVKPVNREKTLIRYNSSLMIR
jgi:hypothetical protein